MVYTVLAKRRVCLFRAKCARNAFIESFDGGGRRELLNPSYFETIEVARKAARIWRAEYNEFRPHSMLANKTPKEFAESNSNHTGSRFSTDRAGLLTGLGSRSLEIAKSYMSCTWADTTPHRQGSCRYESG